MPSGQSLTVSILEKDSAGLLDEWLDEMKAAGVGNDTRMNEAELKQQGAEFLRVLAAAVGGGNNTAAPGWAPVRQFLENVSRSRALQGFSSEETATFIFSLKRPLFTRIRRAASNNPESTLVFSFQ